MIIRINGRDENIGDVSSIEELISRRNLSPGRVVVEHNLKILDREDWPRAVLSEDDRIEIVSFVQGG